ncbi:osmotically inducible lipoprotein OsmE [Microbacterium sp. SLBN-154]|uniref:hypothetical protein n=1 Tax=Microbacterium sp. SLBN-154 TaxID=2768458 RepID=UPI001151F110|nr:hypothetical protein [Microbacterium sp. SLBN-154]TQK17920.1 osmotically inducible lipoprotein OsmE [Microbacterium sp. SLBN-154]
MIATMSATPRALRAWKLAAIAAAVIAAGLVLVGGWWLGRTLFDSQWTLTLDYLMESEPDAADPTTDPQNVTSSVCGGPILCVEAWDTAEALYVRFESRAAAEEHESTVSDGFRSNYIVMDFAGKTSVTKSQQLWAMQHLAGTWQDYEGDFPDR